MAAFGDNLRQERESRGVSLDDIAASTKISVRLLQAIENEDFERLPGGIFNVNFVRQYARQLGLDEEKIVAEYRRLTAPPEPAPNLAGERDWDRPAPSRAWVVAVLVLVAAGGAGVYFWMGGGGIPALPSSSTEPPPLAAAPPASPPPTPTAQAPEANPPAPSAPSTAGSSAPPQAGGTEARLRVELQAREEVWVSASTDGMPRFQITLQPDQKRLVTAQSVVRLRVGDAAALTVTLNGVPQPPLGARGQVKSVVLTPEGMKIVSPPLAEGESAESPQQPPPTPRPPAGGAGSSP